MRDSQRSPPIEIISYIAEMEGVRHRRRGGRVRHSPPKAGVPIVGKLACMEVLSFLTILAVFLEIREHEPIMRKLWGV